MSYQVSPGPSIAREMELSRVRDKKSLKTSTRRILTTMYSSSMVIDWAMYDWMLQIRSNSKELNFTQDLLSKKAQALRL